LKSVVSFVSVFSSSFHEGVYFTHKEFRGDSAVILGLQ
jgi:hypothetical protein